MRIMVKTKLLYLDSELDAYLRALATRRHESISVVIRDLLRDGVRRAMQAQPLPLTQEAPETEA